MATYGRSSDPYRSPIANGGVSPSYWLRLSVSSFIQAPLTVLLEYSGVLRPRPSDHTESERLLAGEASGGRLEQAVGQEESSIPISSGDGEFLIRIVHAEEGFRAGEEVPTVPDGIGSQFRAGDNGASPASQPPSTAAADVQSSDGDTNLGGDNNTESSYQRFDIQQLARWVEQILPFSLLLLVVFIRQYLQGFLVTIWIAAVMFRSNDILGKQTAVKGESKMLVLVGTMVVIMIHVFGVYWWYGNDDLLYPLVFLPPKNIHHSGMQYSLSW